MKLSKKISSRKHNCKDVAIGNWRKKLFVKFYGQPERLNPTDHIVEPNEMVCDSLNTRYI